MSLKLFKLIGEFSDTSQGSPRVGFAHGRLIFDFLSLHYIYSSIFGNAKIPNSGKLLARLRARLAPKSIESGLRALIIGQPGGQKEVELLE